VLAVLSRRLIAAVPPGRIREKARLTAMRVAASRGGFVISKDEWGDRYLLDRSHFLDAYVLVDGAYERRNLAVARQSAAESDLFLDIGANFGLYTVPLSRLVPTIAFEPDPHTGSQLRANLWLNNCEADIRQVAVSDRKGMAELFLSRTPREGNFGIKNPGTTSLTWNAEHHGRDTIQVPTVTLDDEIAVRGQRILIKVDVEGHEVEVAEGMKRLMANNSCRVLAEVFEVRREEWERTMRAAGYAANRAAPVDDHYMLYERRE